MLLPPFPSNALFAFFAIASFIDLGVFSLRMENKVSILPILHRYKGSHDDQVTPLTTQAKEISKGASRLSYSTFEEAFKRPN